MSCSIVAICSVVIRTPVVYLWEHDTLLLERGWHKAVPVSHLFVREGVEVDSNFLLSSAVEAHPPSLLINLWISNKVLERLLEVLKLGIRAPIRVIEITMSPKAPLIPALSELRILQILDVRLFNIYTAPVKRVVVSAFDVASLTHVSVDPMSEARLFT